MKLSPQQIYRWEKIAKRIIEVTVVLVPFIFLPHTGPYLGMGAIKVYLFQALTLIAFVIWIFLRFVVRDLRYTFKLTLIDWLFIAFLGWITLAGLFGASQVTSFWSYYMRGLGIIFYWHLYLFFFLLCRLYSKTDLFKRVLVLVGITGVLMALQTYFGTSGLGIHALEIAPDTSGATLGNSSFLGAYLVISFFVLVYLLVISRKRTLRFLYGAGAVVMLFSPTLFNFKIWNGTVSLLESFKHPVFFLGEARAATLGILIGSLCALWLYFFAKGKKVLRGILVTLLLGVVVASVVVVLQTFHTGTALNRYFTETTGGNRLAYGEVALKAMHDHPVFGFGPENYFIAFEKYFDTKLFDSALIEPWVDKPHNQVLEWGAVAGVPALLLYLALFFVPLWLLMRRSWRERKASPAVLFGFAALIGYFFQNLFLFDTPGTAPLWILLLGFIYILVHEISLPTKAKENNITTARITLGAGSLLVGLGLLVYTSLVPMAKIHALNHLVRVEPTVRADSFARVMHISPVGISRTTAQFADALYQSYANSLQVILSAPDGKVRATKDLMAAATTLQFIEPKDPDNYQNALVIARIGNLVFELSDRKDPTPNTLAHTYAEKLIELSPSNVFGYLTLAQTDVDAGKYQDAIDAMQQAITLEPFVPESRTLLLNLLVFTHQDKEFQLELARAKTDIAGFTYTKPQ